MSSALGGPFARDLIGYGRSPPHPRWPRGARIANNFVMDDEAGPEHSLAGEKGTDQTKTMSCGLHLWAVRLRRFLDYIQQHDKVRVARRSEIAEHYTGPSPGSPASNRSRR